MVVPEIDIENRMLEINEKGWIKTLRKGDTGIGKTLEEELGITENNISGYDFQYNGKFYELKSQRALTSSRITLFTKEGEKGRYKDEFLIKKFGYLDETKRLALKITMTSLDYNNQGFKVEVDNELRKINIVHNVEGLIWYYPFSLIRVAMNEKLANNLCLVFADSKNENCNEFFHYNKAFLLSNLSEEGFAELIREGKLVIEFRMHLKTTGFPRNHGTAFRLSEIYMDKLYKNNEVIM